MAHQHNALRRRLLGAGLAAAALPAARAAGTAATSDWPRQPITIIVANPAGSATDTLARLAADALAQALKQPVVVDNKPGAQGIIGVQAMRRGRPTAIP